MTQAIASTLAFFSLLQTSAAAPPNMTGKWAVHREVEGRQGNSVCTFEQRDKALTGTCTFGDKKVSVSGAIEGERVTWKQELSAEGANSVTYTAPIGIEKLTGTIDVEPLGVTGSFTATRLTE